MNPTPEQLIQIATGVATVVAAVIAQLRGQSNMRVELVEVRKESKATHAVVEGLRGELGNKIDVAQHAAKCNALHEQINAQGRQIAVQDHVIAELQAKLNAMSETK